MRILISAFACSPYKGSEAGVGWGFLSVVAQIKGAEVFVIVEETLFRADIEKYKAEHPTSLSNVHFHFIRHRRSHRLNRIWPPSYYSSYADWHRDAYHLAKKIGRHAPFDLVHQLTMVGYREPGYLWQLGAPFIWGPVGGMGYFPWQFIHHLDAYGAIYFLLYNIINAYQMRWHRRARTAARIAGSGLISATTENQKLIRLHWGLESKVLSEVGIPDQLVRAPHARRVDEELRVIWVGQLLRRKALDLGIEALSKVSNPRNIRLTVIGDGVCGPRWRNMAISLGVDPCIEFRGALSRQETLDEMMSSHVLLITSLRDLTSTVIVEGLAAGLAIVCLDHCGFSDVVDSSCGFKVPLRNRKHVVRELAEKLSLLEQDDVLRRSLGSGALLRSKQHLWREKAAIVDEIYKRALSTNSLNAT